jgi:hypothetical protein
MGAVVAKFAGWARYALGSTIVVGIFTARARRTGSIYVLDLLILSTVAIIAMLAQCHVLPRLAQRFQTHFPGYFFREFSKRALVASNLAVLMLETVERTIETLGLLLSVFDSSLSARWARKAIGSSFVAELLVFNRKVICPDFTNITSLLVCAQLP